jgi:hypothetical protein
MAGARLREQLVRMMGGDLADWHFRDIARSQIDFRFGWKNGHAADIAPRPGFDPNRSFDDQVCCSAQERSHATV